MAADFSDLGEAGAASVFATSAADEVCVVWAVFQDLYNLCFLLRMITVAINGKGA